MTGTRRGQARAAAQLVFARSTEPGAVRAAMRHRPDPASRRAREIPPGTGSGGSYGSRANRTCRDRGARRRHRTGPRAASRRRDTSITLPLSPACPPKAHPVPHHPLRGLPLPRPPSHPRAFEPGGPVPARRADGCRSTPTVKRPSPHRHARESVSLRPEGAPRTNPLDHFERPEFDHADRAVPASRSKAGTLFLTLIAYALTCLENAP